ncbi:hypothetical protein ACIRPU_41975 [Streptomyces sp. NPDC102259]|uniref:hypothetical protein n=1 Tax=Streptomyces sp. NPDC102259 TaxID=3366148 RepID=UPI003822204F
MAALQEPVRKAQASRGETDDTTVADVHDLTQPKKKTAAKKTTAKKTTAKKATEPGRLGSAYLHPSVGAADGLVGCGKGRDAVVVGG